MTMLVYNRDIFLELEREGILASDVIKLLNLAFSHGGYVAGGFARLVARWAWGFECSTRDFKYNVNFHLFNHTGDIDVFFPTSDSLLNFKESCQLRLYASVGGHALQTCTSSGVKIQFIECNIGERDEVVRGFDIINAMASFDRHDIRVFEGWEQLEHDMVLDLHHVSPNTPSRVAKYFHNFRFRSMTSSAEQALMDGAIEIIRNIYFPLPHVGNQFATVPAFSAGYSPSNSLGIWQSLNYLYPKMRLESVVLATTLYSNSQYNDAMKYLLTKNL